MKSQVQIRLFGAFRKISQEVELTLEIPLGSTVSDVRSALENQMRGLKANFDAMALVSQSAIASETRVLEDSDRIESGARLAILPPVCGG